MSQTNENKSTVTAEHRTLIVVRKVLASVVKDVTPSPGMRHPLSEQTIEDIKNCFKLIAARERELQIEASQMSSDRPVYPGREPEVQIVEFETAKSDGDELKKK